LKKHFIVKKGKERDIRFFPAKRRKREKKKEVKMNTMGTRFVGKVGDV